MFHLYRYIKWCQFRRTKTKEKQKQRKTYRIESLIEFLSNRKDIIIITAHKGSNVVIVCVNDNLNKVDRQLFTKKILTDPTEIYWNIFNKTIEQLNNVIHMWRILNNTIQNNYRYPKHSPVFLNLYQTI